VALVSRSFADRYWPGESALGRRLKRRTYTSDFPWITVVGVVEDVHNDGLEGSPQQAFYMLHGQTQTSFSRRMYLVVRADGSAEQAAANLRSRIAAVDPDLPVTAMASLEDVLNDSRATRRLASVMITVFAAAGLLLLATGTYGVVAFAVAQRRAELGVRSALGAEGSGLLGLVLRDNLVYLSGGILAGLVAAAMVSRAIDPTVIPPAQPMHFAFAAGLLLVVGVASALPPAIRASRLDPVISLRTGSR
jgi:ABC-type antimicrobial peptide transport system permease subunit